MEQAFNIFFLQPTVCVYERHFGHFLESISGETFQIFCLVLGEQENNLSKWQKKFSFNLFSWPNLFLPFYQCYRIAKMKNLKYHWEKTKCQKKMNLHCKEKKGGAKAVTYMVLVANQIECQHRNAFPLAGCSFAIGLFHSGLICICFN